jgi:hypothetical protein
VGYSFTDGKLDESFLSPDGARVQGTKGQTLPGLAEHTFNFMLENVWQFSGNWDWVNRVNAYYQSETENHISLNPRTKQTLDDFSIWDVTSSFVSDNWAFTLFAKNLFNEDGIVAVFKEEAFGGDPEQNYFGNSQRNIISRPRTIGVSVSYNF